MNKDKVKDALKQALEDYLTSGEEAVDQHHKLLGSFSALAIDQKFHLGRRIEIASKRAEQMMNAIAEVDN